MTLILNSPQKKRNSLNQLLGGVAAGAGSIGSMFNENEQRKKQEEQLGEENEAAKRFGINLSGIRDKKARQMILDNHLSNQQNQFENENENKFINENIDQPEEFNFKEPSTWSNKQIDRLRALEGKSSKSKTLSNMAKNEFERRQESKKANTKSKESIAPLQSAFETIERMEKIGKKGNLGVGSKYKGIISPTTRKDRSEYERLGKSLIQYSTNIPIRNKQEFETLAHDLYDPSISDDSREGILNAMKRIIQSSMTQYKQPESDEESQTSIKENPVQKQKRPLNVFMKG